MAAGNHSSKLLACQLKSRSVISAGRRSMRKRQSVVAEQSPAILSQGTMSTESAGLPKT